MPPPLSGRHSTPAVPQIDLEAVNFLLIGENDTVMPLTCPPTTKTTVYFTSTQMPVDWFNTTYGKWFKYGINFVPKSIEELYEELYKTNPEVMNQFIAQWESEGMTPASWIKTFNEDGGTSGPTPFDEHWELLKHEFAYNQIG